MKIGKQLRGRYYAVTHRDSPDCWFIVDDATDYNDDNYAIIPATVRGHLTAGRVAEYLDQKAEDSNMHDFVGVHNGLVGLLQEYEVSDQQIVKIMHMLLLRGGLHEL